MNFFLGRLLGKHLCLFFWGVCISKGLADFPVAVLRFFSHHFQISAIKEKVPLLSRCLFAVLCLLRWPSALVASMWLHLSFQLFSLRFLNSCNMDSTIIRSIRNISGWCIQHYGRHVSIGTSPVPGSHPSGRRWNSQNAWIVRRRWTPGGKKVTRVPYISWDPEKFPHLLNGSLAWLVVLLLVERD